MSTHHSSLPDVRTDSSPPISPLENSARVAFTPHKKLPTPSPTKGPTISITHKDTEPPRFVTVVKTPRSSSIGIQSSLSSSRSAPSPVPALPLLSNGNSMKDPQDQQQIPQGPTGHPFLFVPPENYYRMERPRPIKQVSHGPCHGYHTLRGQPVLQLPELPQIPNTPVFAGTGFGEGSEGRSPLLGLLGPPRSAGQDSGWGSEVLHSDIDIDITPPGSGGPKDIELQSYPEHGIAGNRYPHTGDSTDGSRHPNSPHARAERQLSLASLLIATVQDQRQPDHFHGSFLSPYSPHQPSLVPLNSPLSAEDTTSGQRIFRSIIKTATPSSIRKPSSGSLSSSSGTSSAITRCPFISSHLHLSTHTNHLSTHLLSSLNQLRNEITIMTPASAQRYAAFNRLGQYKQDLIKLETNILHVKGSFETLITENRLLGLPGGVKRTMEGAGVGC
ncbi:hypothetical protein FPQ18DRAFT_80409 [Pyronema domesticum]|nr:hypothetical protein FPQ18DRAFT_80409 [Pyronema domesticum]